MTITSYAAMKALVTAPVADKFLAGLDGTGIVGLGLAVARSTIALEPQHRTGGGRCRFHEQFVSAFAIDHTLNAALEFGQRHCIELAADPDRRIRVARRAGEIARTDNFDQCEASRERLEWRVASSFGIASERA